MPPEKFALSVTAPDPGGSAGVPTKVDAGGRGKWIPGFGTDLMPQQKLTLDVREGSPLEMSYGLSFGWFPKLGPHLVYPQKLTL